MTDTRRIFTEKQKQEIFARDNHTCRACGYDNPFGFGLAADHIIPHAKGGMTTTENGQTLCQACNGAKGKIVFPETLPIRKPLKINDKSEWQAAIQENQETFRIACQRIRNGENKSPRGKRILKPRV
jgi:5-methylcytosine-specific restriction endonuclease McrA